MPGVAFLIDADNLATVSDVEEAFAHLPKLGAPISVRRAYGGHEKLAGLKDALKRFAVRSFVNQGRGTTDVALAVDTMDLLHGNGLPKIVAIGSSDADFAPLALRLREAGIHVVCVAQREKADAEALSIAYDEVIYLGESQGVRKAPRGRVTSKAVSPATKTAAKKPAALNVDAATVMAAVPGLRDGRALPLNDVTKQLRDAKLLGKSAKSTILLGKLKDHFRLTPEGQPSHVQWTGRAPG